MGQYEVDECAICMQPLHPTTWERLRHLKEHVRDDWDFIGLVARLSKGPLTPNAIYDTIPLPLKRKDLNDN